MISLDPRLEKVRRMCRKLKPILGQDVERLFQVYQIEGQEGRSQIEAHLELLVAKHLPGNLDSPTAELLPPPTGEAQGDYPIGEVVYGGKVFSTFGIREKECIQHVACFGRTGAGKTNLGYILFREFCRGGKPVLVFDWKRNYRDLLDQDEYDDLEVYTIGRPIAPLRFNPLIPPEGIRPKTWLKKIIQVIAHAYMLGNGVLYLLQTSLDAIYEEFGVYAGTMERYPTFRDVLERLKHYNAKGREAGWLSSTLRALASLCFGDMDELVNRGDNRSLERILNTSTILELDALTQSDKVFFVQALLLWIHHKRMSEGSRETFKHAVFIEESHQVLSNERRSLLGGQTVMDITFREIREFGECMVLFDQHPSQISLPALGNTYTTICLNLKHAKDINTMSQAMLLDGPEKDLLGALKVGEAVVKVQGRIPGPFLVRIPEFKITKGAISDDDVRRHMAGKLQRVIIRDVTMDMFELGEPGTPASLPGHIASQIEEAFLQDVASIAESGIAARYKRLGISVRQGQRLKVRLADKGLIDDHEERTQTGRIRIIRLTEQGEQFLSGKENSS